ncbi:MAG: 2OG-Fe(II) oxygenase [Vulcanimicrobiota bacterium]
MQTCFTLDDVLTPDECRHFIQAASYRPTGQDYPASYRDNDRLVLDDPGLAERLMERLRAHLPPVWPAPGGGQWQLDRLNSRFRGCRYRDGQQFSRHRDGAYCPDAYHRSFLTVMVYLNEGSEFDGGSTRFYPDRWSSQPCLTVAPRRGTGAVFEHSFWHDGQAVSRGTKYVLRTDVIYRSQTPQAGHLGYVWDLLELPDGRIASASRDQTVRLWNRDLEPLAVLAGHQASVTALAWFGQQLWSGGRDRQLIRRDSKGQPLHSFQAHGGAILTLLASPDGLYSAGADARVCLWSERGELIASFACPSWPWALLLTDEGLWVGCETGHLRLHHPRSGRLLREWLSPSGVLSLAGDGPRLLAGCQDAVIRAFAPDGSATCLVGHRGPVSCLARSPRGLLSGGQDDGIRLWSGQFSQELGRRGDFVRKVLPLADGRLVSAGYDGLGLLAWPGHMQVGGMPTMAGSE